eukprot:COSAG01_NODE_26551_length_710_cov_1.489362_2_plen_26_part_01
MYAIVNLYSRYMRQAMRTLLEHAISI